MPNRLFRLVGAIALIGGMIGAGSASAGAHEGDRHDREGQHREHDSSDEVRFDLAPSSPDIARCFPNLKAQVEVDLQTAQKGRDEFEIKASGLPSGEEFTVF